MIKRAAFALAFLALSTVAHAAGTIPGFSLTPQFDTFGKVMPGCKLYVIQAGTTATPQNAYQDSSLTVTLPNPLTCDASGRLPQWFVADGLIKVRLTDKNLTQQFVGDNLLVVGASSGGGGGGGVVDPTTIAATGDIKSNYTVSTLTGWVRMNGRYIGSASSGADERANADTQALFVFLWNNDANLGVAGGRGASAAADWAANKAIQTPDLRGRVLAGLDTMGNVDASRLTSGLLAVCRFTLGCAGGESAHVLTLAELASGITSGNAAQSISVSPPFGQSVAAIPGGNTINSLQVSNLAGGSNWVPVAGATGWGAQNTFSAINSIGVTSNNTSGQGHNNMQPTMLITWFIKL